MKAALTDALTGLIIAFLLFVITIVIAFFMKVTPYTFYKEKECIDNLKKGNYQIYDYAASDCCLVVYEGKQVKYLCYTYGTTP